MKVTEVVLHLADKSQSMTYDGGLWKNEDVSVSIKDSGAVSICAEDTPVCKLQIFLEPYTAPDAMVFGDAWERAYADLEWKKPDAGRKMPWYFFAYDGEKVHCYGVKTQPNALCFWNYNGQEVSITLDLRSGTNPLALQGRTLDICTLVTAVLETELHSACAEFCRMLCDNPRVVNRPIYGGNDWYCNYGDNSYEKIKQHAQRIAECAANCPYPPYMVIDDGWQICHMAKGNSYNGGPWLYCNSNFGDMEKMAAEIRNAGAIPGIWFRPLETMEKLPSAYYLDRDFNNVTLDPSVPEVLTLIQRDVRQIVKWGYRLIKHDFSSADIFGKWGFEMSDDLYYGRVNFADKSRTTAEIMKAFYLAIREAAGDEVLIMGCNTFSHLSAGIMDIQRTGDDTSGREWERTKAYGINTLAFRMMQHGAFYCVDADCVGITNDISWEKNSQWLDVLAKSGTPLFVSIAQDAYHEWVREDVRKAFETACQTETVSRALDWLNNKVPEVWESAHGTDKYSW